jgi:LPXTG-motif cell wall-anchored protein
MHPSMDTLVGLIAGILVGLAIVAYTRRKRNQ